MEKQLTILKVQVLEPENVTTESIEKLSHEILFFVRF